jgi:hypothetical protein
MLAAVLTFSLVIPAPMFVQPAFAADPVTVDLQVCKTGMSEGTICWDENEGRIGKWHIGKAWFGITGENKYKTRRLSKSDYNDLLKINAVNSNESVTVTGGGGSNSTTGTVTESGPGVVVNSATTTGGGSGDVTIVVPGSSGSTSKKKITLTANCDDFALALRDQTAEQAKADKAVKDNKEAKKKFKAALDGCHDKCVKSALSTSSSSSCHFSKMTNPLTSDEFCAYLSKADFNSSNGWVNDFKTKITPAPTATPQPTGTPIVKKDRRGRVISKTQPMTQPPFPPTGPSICENKLEQENPGAVCALLVAGGNSDCLSYLSDGNLGCADSEFAAWIKAKDNEKAQSQRLDDLSLPETTVDCTFARIEDINKATFDAKRYSSVPCLTRLVASCHEWLDPYLTKSNSNDCADCQTNAQQQALINAMIAQQRLCLTGTCGGPSKAAQIIGAIGGIGVPIGLGLMGLNAYKYGLNSCVSMYNTQMAWASNAGQPPQSPTCGTGGFGMGGFSPLFSMGMGGLYGGMNGGLNGGLNFGFNPMLNLGLGGGFNLGLGGGFNPMMGGGMYGGFNPMMGGGMYGGFNPMMGGGMYGGFNPMMGGGFNPMMGGGFNPMMGGGNGLMGIQQQMMDAQMRMQALAGQRMSYQNGMMMGQTGMYAGMNPNMGGMYGGYNPMMGGNLYGGYNPMMGGSMYGYPQTGLNVNAGLNLNLGGGLNFGGNPYGYGGYNPYSYGGYNPYQYGMGGMGGGCGFYVSGVPCGP